MALFQRGGLNLGRIAGVSLRLHWTLLVAPFVFTGLRFDAVTWATFFALLVAHQLGHAVVVKAAGGTATLVELTGYGGYVFWQGDVSPKGRAAIAWGGIWAQLLVLAGAEAWLRAVGAPSSFTAVRIISTLIEANLWLIAVNLVPLPPLDGAEAWRLPILLGRALRRGEPAPLPVMPHGTTHDDAFESGARRDEVKAIVSSLLDEARKP